MAEICARVGASPAEPVIVQRMIGRSVRPGSASTVIWIQDTVGLGTAGEGESAGRTDRAVPGPDAGRECRIVFDGRLTNRAELESHATGLAGSPGSPGVTSDADLVRHLYEQHGRAVVGQLRGAFAMIIWDGRTQQLFAARDHLGQKPLFYARRGGQFLIASEIKALLAADPELREVDAAALDEYLAMGWVASPRTLFQHVRQLPPAHTLTYDARVGLTTQRYWHFDYEPKLPGRDEDLVDEWERRLVDAARAQVAGVAPVAALLNGGLDAALLVALLREHQLVDELPTYCVGLGYGECDEGPAARRVAQRFGTPHYERYARLSIRQSLPGLVAQFDGPPAPGAVYMSLTAQLAAEHRGIVVTGMGGAELFGGHAHYLGHRAATEFARLPAKLRRLLGATLVRVPPARLGARGRRLLRLLHLAAVGGGERYRRIFDAEGFPPQLKRILYGATVRDQLGEFAPGAVTEKAYEHAPTTELVDRMLHADLQSHLPDVGLAWQHRLMAFHGVEARNPYLNSDLFAFAARLPTPLKIRGSTLGWAQRELARRYLPASLLSATAPRNPVPLIQTLLRDELAAIHSRCLQNMELAHDGFFAGGAVSQLLQEHRSGAVDHARRLWLLATSEIWYRLCIRGQTQSDLEDQLVEPAPAAPAAA